MPVQALTWGRMLAGSWAWSRMRQACWVPEQAQQHWSQVLEQVPRQALEPRASAALACMLGLALRLPHKLGGLQDSVLGPERCQGLMQELAGDCSSTREKVPLWALRLQRSALPGSS